MKRIIITLISAFLLITACFSLAACDRTEGTDESKITNLTYNGESISWSSVKNAKSYKISINGGTEILIGVSGGTLSYKYDANGEDFDFHIEAIVKEDSEDNPEYTIHFTNIGTVSGVKVEAGELRWDALDRAEKYEVMYNGDIVAESIGTVSYALGEGDFACKVRALSGLTDVVDGNNPYYSVWSETVSGRILPSPKNLTYDSESFTWERVEGASAYVIRIANEEFTSVSNKFSYTAGENDFTVSVRAVGNSSDKVYDSAFGESKKYTYITPIEGLDVVDGVLVWSASENAVRYRIKVNGLVQNQELTENEFSALSSGSSYRIQIMPIGDGDFWFSRWSNEITVNILRSPVVSYGDGVIRWNQVTGSAGYELKITKNDTVVHTATLGQEVFVYNYAFEEAGDYLVSVKATALGTGGIYESKFSQPYSVKRLATPKNEQIVNRPLEQNQVSVNFSPVAGATSYSLLADGVEIATARNASTFSVDLSKMTSKNEESAVNFKIYAKGSVTNAGAVLDCLIPLEFNVTKLATPANLSINGNQISWDSVNHTSKYVLTIDGKRTEVTTTSYTLTDLSAGMHTVYVQAMGNGEEVITGSFSTPLEIKKLATPSNLIIANGLLTWGMVADATAYKLILGTTVYNADSTYFDILGYSSYISEGTGTQISVYAIGNGSNVIDSDVSATKTISKYERPSTVKVTGDNLVWNPSSTDGVNCNSYKIIISEYGATDYTVNVSGTSYSMSNFEPGTYTVKVVAVGDLVTTVDSPESDPYQFNKLEAVKELYKNGSSYSWDAIFGATSYEIKLSKDATWITVNGTSYTPTFTTEGEFEVSIRAIGDGTKVINSDISSFTQRVTRLTQPVHQEDMTNSNSFKVEVSGNTITVTLRKQDGAKGYKLFIGGIERTSVISETDTEITYSFTMTTVGATYSVQVQIIGGTFSSGGNYMIDSNKSTEISVTYTV